MMKGDNISDTANWLVRVIPLFFSVLAAACGLLLPRIEGLYVLGCALAAAFALAVPLSYAVLSARPRPQDRGIRTFMMVALSVLGASSAVMAGVLLSFGSSAGAAGDIGGMFLWLASTGVLLLLTVFAAVFWPKGSRVASP